MKALIRIEATACGGTTNQRRKPVPSRGATRVSGGGDKEPYLLPKVKLTPAKYLKLFWLFAMCAMWLLLKFVYR